MILTKIKITGLLLLVFFSVIFPQSDLIDHFYGKVPTNKFLITSWSSDNGLPQNSVNDIAQTKDGYLWFATFDGLVRFDGSEFVVYNQSNTNKLLSNRITALSTDTNGGLWIGTENGQILRYENYKFTDFTNKLNAKKYPIFYISATDSKEVSVSTGADYIIYRKHNIKHYPHSQLYSGNHIFNMIKNDEGQINILSNIRFDVINNGIIKTFNNIKLSDLNLIKGYKSNRNNWFDSKFTLSYSTENLQFHRIKKVIFSRKALRTNNYELNYIFIDSKKGIWLATKSGLFLETRKGEYKFSGKNLQDEIYKVFEDSDGNIWVGTATKGVIKLSKRSIYNIVLKNAHFNDVLYPVLQRKNGEIWVGSNGNGLARIKGNSIDYFTYKDGLINTSIWSLFEDNNKRLWVGSYGGGLLYLNGKKFVKFNMWDSLISKVVFSIYEDTKGGLWIGTNEGLGYYFDNKLSNYSIKNGLSSKVIHAITEGNDGTIWFATDNGLTYIKNNKFYKLKIFGNYKIYNFRSLYIDKSGRLWAGTYGQGLYSYYKGKVSAIGKEDGLFDNVVSTIREDEYGNYWMTSNHGLYRVSRENLLSFINGKTKEIFSIVYQKKDGFLSNEFNGGQMSSSSQLQDGILLFPSFSGLVAVRQNIGKVAAKYHKVYVDQIIVNDKKYEWKKEITVLAGNNNITFHLSVIEFNKPELVRLRYKIFNLSDSWTAIKNIRTINFADIQPGEYELKIQENSGNGKWQNVNGIIRFRVLASFYQTIWFDILILLFFGIFVYMLFQLRMRSLKKRNEILELSVKERTQKIEMEKKNTLKALEELKKEKEKVDNANKEKTELMRIVAHDLKNPISAVRGSAELIISDASDSETVKELADIIINATGESLEMITQFLQQSEVEDPRYKLEITKVNICDLLKDVINSNKILAERKGQKLSFEYNCENEIIVELDENKITSVLGNLISNAIKYTAKNKNIRITLNDLGEGIKICVIDQGPGLTEEDHKNLFKKFAKLSARPTGNETSTGLGLSIVKKIVELHGGKVGAESVLGEGSKFFVILPKEQKD